MIKTLKVLINIRFKYTIVISIIHFIWFAQKTQPIYYMYINSKTLAICRLIGIINSKIFISFYKRIPYKTFLSQTASIILWTIITNFAYTHVLISSLTFLSVLFFGYIIFFYLGMRLTKLRSMIFERYLL
jgi:hypothetical protein